MQINDLLSGFFYQHHYLSINLKSRASENLLSINRTVNQSLPNLRQIFKKFRSISFPVDFIVKQKKFNKQQFQS